MADFFMQFKNRFYILPAMKNDYEKIKIHIRTD